MDAVCNFAKCKIALAIPQKVLAKWFWACAMQIFGRDNLLSVERFWKQCSQ